MNRGVNRVTLVGNLGQDPETRCMPASSVAVTNISVATSESWKDKTTGELQERTEWHRVVMFGKLAEIAAEYLRKGSQVYLEGQLQTRKWTDNNGVERYTTEVKAHEMQMLGNRGPVAPRNSGAQASGGDSAGGPPLQGNDNPF